MNLLPLVLAVLLAAEPPVPGDHARTVQVDDASAVSESPSIAWEDAFRPIFPERASYPRAVQLADARIVATFAYGIPGGRAIALSVSNDGGKNWGNYQRIYEHPKPIDLDNAYPVQITDGTILVAYRCHDRDRKAYRILVSSSGDGGRSWANRSTIATGVQGIWEPCLLSLPDGVVQAYYATEEGCYPDQRIEMRSSLDGGKSWRSPVIVAQKQGSRDGMPGVVQLDGQNLLAVFEATDVSPYRFVIRGVRSADLGQSWSTTRELIYCPGNPISTRWAAGAPAVVRLHDGRLLVSFQSDENVSYLRGDRRSDPHDRLYNYLSHTHFAYVASFDNGRSWLKPVHLIGGPDEPANWNALYSLNNRTVLALTNHRGKVGAKLGFLDATEKK
jgi:hypothetical protein